MQKAEIRKQERTMKVILENKEDIAKTLIQLLNQEQKKEGEKDEDK